MKLKLWIDLQKRSLAKKLLENGVLVKITGFVCSLVKGLGFLEFQRVGCCLFCVCVLLILACKCNVFVCRISGEFSSFLPVFSLCCLPAWLAACRALFFTYLFPYHLFSFPPFLPLLISAVFNIRIFSPSSYFQSQVSPSTFIPPLRQPYHYRWFFKNLCLHSLTCKFSLNA